MMRTTIGALAALLLGCGCASPGPVEGPPASARERLTLRTSEALQLASILGYELSELPGDPPSGEEPPVTVEDEPAPGPSGAEPAGDGGCTDLDWEPSNPFGLTLRFDGCELDTGESVYGTVAVRLARDGRGSVEADLSGLAIGDRLISGTMTLGLQGAGVRIDADLTYLDGDTVMGIELTGVTLEARADGVHLDGEGAIDEGPDRWYASFSDVTWSLASLCHPSAGSVDLERPGEPPVTITFSPSGIEMQEGTAEPSAIPSGC